MPYWNSVVLFGSIIKARSLNWSAMLISPLASCTAFVGDGFGLLLGALLVKYWKTTCLPGVTISMRLWPESTINVLPLGRRLAKAAVISPWLYCHTICPARVISMTLLLFSSAIRICPLESNSALLGLLSAPLPEVGPYIQTIFLLYLPTSITRLFPWSTIIILWLGNWMAKTGTFNWLGPEPVTPACPYCQTICPA